MTQEYETPYLTLRNQGASLEDTFITGSEMFSGEDTSGILKAFEDSVDPVSALESVKAVDRDITGMVQARRDKRIEALAGNIDELVEQGGASALAPFKEAFRRNKSENLRKAAELVLFSDDPKSIKQARLNALAAAYQSPNDDVENYAHETVQESTTVLPPEAAARAEAAATYVNNTPVGLIKKAIRSWEERSALNLAVVQSFNPFEPSDLRMSKVINSLGFGNENVRGSTALSVEDNLKAWEQEYGNSSSSTQRKMVIDAIKAIEVEADGDALFARYTLDRLFKPVVAYADSGDYRAAEVERSQRLIKGTAFSVAEIGGSAVDLGSLAIAGKSLVDAGVEGVKAVKAIKAAEGVSTSDAVEILKVGYGVKKGAEANAKRAAKEAKASKRAAAKAARVASLEPGTAASIDALLNPERLKAKMLESFSEEGASRSAAYGADDAASLNAGALPRPQSSPLKDIPYIGEQLGVAKAYEETLTATVNRLTKALSDTGTYFLRGKELANVVERSTDELVQAFKDAEFGDVAINQSQQFIVEDGVLTQYVISGKGKAFTAEEAAQAATVYNTEFDDIVRLLKKDEVSGEWQPMPAPKMRWDRNGNLVMTKQPPGEYAIGLVRHTVYNPQDAVGTGAVLEGHLGRFATQADKSTQFAKDINDMGTWAEKLRGQLEYILADTMTKFNKLGGANVWKKRKSQARVMNAINSGAGSDGVPGKLYNSDELIEMGLNADEMSAYYAVRARFDAEYFLNNKAAREDFLRAGYTREVMIDGQRHFLKPLEAESLDGVKKVVNTKGEVVVFDKDSYINGEDFQVFQLRRAIHDGTSVVNKMVVRASDSWPEGATYGKIGNYVLPYHQGYVPRMYDAKYIVTKAMKTTDDTGATVDFEKAIATARNYRNAVAFALKNGLAETDVRLAREAMQPGRGVFDNAGRKRTYNGVIFGRRGTKLEDAEVGHVQDVPLLDGDRNLKTLANVLSSSSGLTSYRQTMEKVVNRHIDRWNSEYGPNSPLKDYKWNLNTIKAMEEPNEPALLEAYREATAFRDHIAMLQGTDETVMNTAMNKFRAAIANSAAKGALRRMLPKNWADAMEETYRDEIGRDMASRIKNVNFILFMAVNPAAQLVLQASQVAAYIGLKGGAKYTMSGQYTRDFMGLMAGVALRGKTDAPSMAAYKSARIAAGKTQEEFDAMVDAFSNSGILQGIDRHQYLDAVVANAYRTEGGVFYHSGAGYYAQAVIDTLRKVGFNAGETINQTSAWLFARQRMIANDSKLTGALLDTDANLRKQVVTMAVNIGGNMDTSARLKHQDGLLGIILQFTSYGTKMSQMMIPRNISIGSDGMRKAYFNTLGRFGSDVYTNREKMFVALTQLGLFGTLGTTYGPVSGGAELPGTDIKPGTIGYWLADTFLEDEGLDPNGVPTYARDAIAQGFMGATANAVFSEIYGERTLSDWSGRFAPIGNLKSAPGRMFEIVNSILMQDYSNVANFLSGPSMTQVQKMVAAGEAGGNMLTRAVVASVTGYSKPDGVSDSVVFFDKCAQLVPALNNWKQGEFADKTGYFRTMDGSRSVEANGGEADLRRILGLRPQEELALSAAKNAMTGSSGEMGYGDAEGIQELSTKMWREMKLMQANLDEGKMTWNQFEERMGWLTTLTTVPLNDMERRKLRGMLAEKYLKDSLESKDKSFVAMYSKRLENYDIRFNRAHKMLTLMPEFKGKRELLERVRRYEEQYANRYGKEE